MADLPHTGQGEWEGSQASPWITQNHLNRTFDAFCVRITALSRETSPPADCVDGACFLIDSGASGDWAGEDGGVAIAKGADAVNGWIIIPADTIEREGNEIFIVEERVTLQRQVNTWVAGVRVFVDTAQAFDGATIRWDQSNGLFYFAEDQGGSDDGAVVLNDADDYTLDADHVGRYIRLTAAGSKTITIQDEMVEPLPANGEWHIRNVQGGDATIVPGVYTVVNLPADGSYVIPPGGTVTLKRVAQNELDLMGLVASA